MKMFSFFPFLPILPPSGLLWSRYSTVIVPKNWNLFSVNIFLCGVGVMQCSRILM